MFGPGFLAGAWRGGHRTVECPYCRKKQTIGRRPPPFEMTCRRCHREFRVEHTGAVATRKD